MGTAKFMSRLTFPFAMAAIIGCGLLIAAAQQAAADKGRCILKAGDKAFTFQTQGLDGKTVNFPDDFKGKVVLLDFWATWCPDCREELPNVVSAYKKFHDAGFEIVGVSLDQPQKENVLRQFIKDHDMPWPEIYDGGYWDAAIAVKYGVHAIPCPVLVDSDTGSVLAVGNDAIGRHLAKAVKKALDAKSKK